MYTSQAMILARMPLLFLFENKILFSLGTRPTAPTAQTSNDKRQQSLFDLLLTVTALQWFKSEVTDTTDWSTLKNEFKEIHRL